MQVCDVSLQTHRVPRLCFTAIKGNFASHLSDWPLLWALLFMILKYLTALHTITRGNWPGVHVRVCVKHTCGSVIKVLYIRLYRVNDATEQNTHSDTQQPSFIETRVRIHSVLHKGRIPPSSPTMSIRTTSFYCMKRILSESWRNTIIFMSAPEESFCVCLTLLSGTELKVNYESTSDSISELEQVDVQVFPHWLLQWSWWTRWKKTNWTSKGSSYILHISQSPLILFEITPLHVSGRERESSPLHCEMSSRTLASPVSLDISNFAILLDIFTTVHNKTVSWRCHSFIMTVHSGNGFHRKKGSDLGDTTWKCVRGFFARVKAHTYPLMSPS